MVKLRHLLLSGCALCFGCSSGSGVPATKTVFGAYDAAAGLPELTQSRDRRASSGDLYLVQFSEATVLSQRAALRSTGAQLLRYFPEHAFIVRATASQAGSLSQQAGVRVVTPFPDLLRVSPALLQDPASQNQSLDVSNPEAVAVYVETASAASMAGVVSDIAALGGDVLATPRTQLLGRVLAAKLTRAQMAGLLANLDVLAIEPRGPMVLHNDAEYGILQDGTANSSPVWDHNLLGQGQVVAVADAALSVDSCRLSSGKYVKIIKNVDESGASGTPVTFNDAASYLHGTHVVSTLLGDNFNNGTYDLQDGMAPAAQLYFEGLGDNLAGVPADLSDLFEPAYAAGAYIHSNSWGGTNTTYDALARSLDGFVWSVPTYLVVFSAGNGGGAGTITSPATAKNVIAVGSMDNTNDISGFSSQGPTPDGRIKPDLVGSGNNVVSAAWSSNINDTPPGSATCATTTLSGTSMAAANVAGGATLVRQYFVDGFYPSGAADTNNTYLLPSAALMRATLLAGAVDMTGLNTGGTFPAAGQGFGRLQLDNALYFTGGTQRLYVNDVTTGVSTGASHTYTLHVQYNTPLKIVLTWSDPQAAANASVALVNNLDLQVRDGSGNIYKGNVLTDGNSVTGGTADANNVQEMVYFTSATPGVYTVTVTGTSVPGDASAAETGAQPYAIAAVGSFLATDLTPLLNTTSGSGGASGGGGSASGSDPGSDPAAGASGAGYGIAKSSGCSAVAANDALLILAMMLFYFMPKPPRRRRVRVRR